MDIADIIQLASSQLDGSISAEDQKQLQEALDSDPDFKAQYQEVIDLLQSEQGKFFLDPVKREEGIQQVLQGIDQMETRRKRSVLYIAVAAAAGLAGMIFFGWKHQAQIQITSIDIPQDHVSLTLQNGSNADLSTDSGKLILGNLSLQNSGKSLRFNAQNSGDTQHANLYVPAGKDYALELADGSRIWLNSKTRIIFPLRFDKRAREIDLDGEAFLSISPDQSRPFTVHLPTGDIRVLGTEFNINAYKESSCQIALVNGQVRIELGKDSLTLNPGYRFRSNISTHGVVERFDTAQVLSWRKGVYYYKGASLKDLSIVFDHWFNLGVSLDNDRVNSMKFDGSIRRDEDIQQYLTNLQYVNGPDFYIKDSVIHFK